MSTACRCFGLSEQNPGHAGAASARHHNGSRGIPPLLAILGRIDPLSFRVRPGFCPVYCFGRDPRSALIHTQTASPCYWLRSSCRTLAEDTARRYAALDHAHRTASASRPGMLCRGPCRHPRPPPPRSVRSSGITSAASSMCSSQRSRQSPRASRSKTWRGGAHRGAPKLPPAAQSLLDRGLARLDETDRLPRLFLTPNGLAALRQMMADPRLANPQKFAHVRRELGIDPRPEKVIGYTNPREG